MTHLRLDVYDALNATYQGTIAQAISNEFVDEYNGPGVGTVTVPLDSADADLLAKDAVVRVIYRDAVRYSWFVETRERTLGDAGNRYTLTASGRGLLAWLEDAVVYPQGGLADFTAPDRPFNFASADGAWTSSGNYQAALGVRQKDDTTARAKLPVRWKDPNAYWIWFTDPASTVKAGTVNWFRKDFTMASRAKVKFYASCDNTMDVYLDGALIMSSSDFDEQATSFSQMARFTIDLGSGTHTLAAMVRNGKPWTRYDVNVDADSDKVEASNHGLANGDQVKITDKKDADGLTNGNTYYVVNRTDDDFKLSTTSGGSAVNVTKDGKVDLKLQEDTSAGFILCAFEQTAAGKDGDLVTRTNTSWEVSSVEPYWRPAMILKTLAQEAATRGVYRLDQLTYGYTTSTPSSGSWTTEVDLTIKVGADLLTVLNDMVDLGHDFWLNPTTMELEAWESRGTDRSGEVLLDTGINLMKFSTTVERPIKTVALVRSKRGWLRAAANNRTTNGWRETFLEYGNTRSEAVAKRNAERVLRRTSKATIVASTDVVITDDAIPYVDFDVADLVSIPNPTGQGLPYTARVLSISMKEEGGGVNFQPELEVINA